MLPESQPEAIDQPVDSRLLNLRDLVNHTNNITERLANLKNKYNVERRAAARIQDQCFARLLVITQHEEPIPGIEASFDRSPSYPDSKIVISLRGEIDQDFLIPIERKGRPPVIQELVNKAVNLIDEIA